MLEETKVCRSCRSDLPLSEFYISRTRNNEVASHCKACKRAKAAAYRAANSDEVRRKAAEKRERTKDDIKRRNAAYYEKNKEKVKAQVREWREANPGQFKVQKTLYYERNREKIIAARAAYVKLNPEKVLLVAKRWREKNREKARAIGRAACKRWRRRYPEKALAYSRASHASRRGALDIRGSILGPIIKRLKMEQRGKCACCRKRLQKFHVDHITAITKGGKNESRNFQLLCPPCNIAKSNHDPIDFMQSRGFLL